MGCENGHCEEKERSKLGTILFAGRLIFSLTFALLGQFLWKEESVGLVWNLFVMGVTYLVIAYDIILKALHNIFIDHEFFDENFLMVIASLGAFALRAFGPEHNEFLEGILVIWLYQVGEFLSDLASDKSREAIVSAIDLREEKALLLVDGKVEEVKAEDLKKGDIVSLMAGRKVQCDGIVISGSGEVDESSLTGEALPVHKEVGDRLYSGTLLIEGSLQIEASCDYKDSTVAKLMELIEEGAEEKSKTTRFITKFAKAYTPIVILIALVLATVPPFFIGATDGAVWARWIFVALSLLVISCPCAIVISVPLAYFSGLGLASKHGILVKGASYFDKALELKGIAFDKTGTLTKGNIGVESVELNNDEYAPLIARAESASSHPLAKAISALYPNEKLSEKDEVEEVGGRGLKAQIDGHQILVGNASLLQENGVFLSAYQAFLGVYCAVDGKYIGRIIYRDEFKANSKQTVAELHGFNVKTAVFSGDREALTKEVSNTLGCDYYQAELLPSMKQDAVREFQKEVGGAVGFCGDGINDAPTLAYADIGFAMGKGGADVALDNADVVLTDDDPHKVVSFLRIAKSTRNVAMVDIGGSLFVKAAIATLSLVAAISGAFTLPLWVAVLADSGLASVMVLNSLALYYRKVK